MRLEIRNHEKGGISRTAIVTQRKINGGAVFARAFGEVLQRLCVDTMMEGYLLGTVSREQAPNTLGMETIKEVEYQREALKHDVECGLSND